MTPVAFTVMGPPKGKGRPRFRRQGNGVVTFTPADTVEYEKGVMIAAKMAMGGRDPFRGPVAVTIYAVFGVPPSAYPSKRKKMLDGEIHPGVIDLDNIIKICLDGAQGIVFANDRDVVSLTAVKLYGETARVHVVVRPLGEAFSEAMIAEAA